MLEIPRWSVRATFALLPVSKSHEGAPRIELDGNRKSERRIGSILYGTAATLDGQTASITDLLALLTRVSVSEAWL